MRLVETKSSCAPSARRTSLVGATHASEHSKVRPWRAYRSWSRHERACHQSIHPRIHARRCPGLISTHAIAGMASTHALAKSRMTASPVHHSVSSCRTSTSKSRQSPRGMGSASHRVGSTAPERRAPLGELGLARARGTAIRGAPIGVSLERWWGSQRLASERTPKLPMPSSASSSATRPGRARSALASGTN